MENTEEQKNVEQELNANVEFDLLNEEDRKVLQELIASQGEYFKPEVDVPYKVILTNSQVAKVEKQFGDDIVTKYAINIKASNAAGETFEGIWEVGKSVIQPVFKHYKEGVRFNVTKSGSGTDTRYAVVVDF